MPCCTHDHAGIFIRHLKAEAAVFGLLAILAIIAIGAGRSVAVAAPLQQSEGHTADLIISEYIDGEGGTANDKVIEIYNGTESFKNLESYYLEVYNSDKGNSGDPQQLRLSEVQTAIDPGQSIVVVKSNPSSETLKAWYQWDGLLFDGNDVVILRNVSSAEDQVIDSIGQLGSLPPNGTDWRGVDANGRSVSTRDQGLRRKPDVCSGRADASNQFDPAREWTTHPNQDFSDLGKHTVKCTPPVINEFVFQHIGANDHEFIEVKIPGQHTYNAYTVLVVNGNAGPNVGRIYRQYRILDTNIPSNGYWTTGFLFDQIDDGTNTILLVRNFTGNVGDDIDTDNNGSIDYAPWAQIVDDVAVSLMRSGDRTYSQAVLTPNYDGIPALPGGASRIPDGQDTNSATDWLRNHFDGEGLGCAQCRPGATNNLAVNTPGQSNRRGTSTITPTPLTVTPTGTHSPTPATPLPANCVNIVVNGGFEQNHEGWKFGDDPVPPRFVSEQRTEGMRSVLLGNPPDSGSRNLVSFSSIRQLVKIPSDATVAYITWSHLSLTQEAVTADPGSHADRQDMIVLAPNQMPMAIKYRARLNETEWKNERKELTEFLGKNFYIYFNAFNDGNGQRTWMYLDNVQVVVCYPPGVTPGASMSTPTPMPFFTLPPTGTPTATSTSTPDGSSAATGTPTPTSTTTISTSVSTTLTATVDVSTSATTPEPETSDSGTGDSGTGDSAPDGGADRERNREVGTPVVLAGGCVELIVNGGFEKTGVGWTIPLGDEQTTYTSDVTHGSSRQAMQIASIEGSRAAGISAVEQVVTLPSDYERIILDFQYYLVSEPEPGPGDLQYVDIYNQFTEQFEDRVLSAQRNDERWAHEQADLAHLAGEEIRLRFAVNNDGVAGRSAMYVDNVSLRACGYTGEGVPTPIGKENGETTSATQTVSGGSTNSEATPTAVPSTTLDGPPPLSSAWQNRLGAFAILAGILVVIALLVWGILYALRPNQPPES